MSSRLQSLPTFFLLLAFHPSLTIEEDESLFRFFGFVETESHVVQDGFELALWSG